MARLSKFAPAKVNASLRRREAAELRARKLSAVEVAEQMGISETRVRQLWVEWDKAFTVENKALAETIRDEQLNEIRLMKHVLFPVVISPDGTPRHVDSYIKLLAHEATIAGAKAPTETKTTLLGPDGGPVQTVAATMDLSKVDTDRLQMLHAMLQDIATAQAAIKN
jgi:hypothetical protein